MKFLLSLLASLLAAALLVLGLAPASARKSASLSEITFTGHGFGHGRGMGQYGAFGYALQGWNYHQILDHYYGGTVAGTAPSGTVMTVDMISHDGLDTIVVQERGELSAPGVTSATGSVCAVRIERTSGGHFEVWQGTACTGGGAGWKVVNASLAANTVAVVATASSIGQRQDMLQLCDSDGTRWLHGDIWAVDTGSSQATVNHVPLESYVQDVVPNESPASWGSSGGEAALEAQAVAARSYALADTRASYAKTCDSTECQVYAGVAFQDNRGNFSSLEYANSNQAVTQTAGEVRMLAGAVALTEYSSSTGGYTAGGTFPAVPDDGDATPSNPNHNWTMQIAASDISAAYGMGQLESIAITGRNGLGDMGGRVTTMTLVFSDGSVPTTGAEFAGNVGLLSDWFTTASAPTPTPVPVPSGYYVVTSAGTVTSYGGAPAYGSFNAPGAGTTAVSIATRHSGYWVLGGNGTVHYFGSASWHGSLSGKALNAPPFQLVATPSGNGYWIVAFDGGVFSFGDAGFHGSTGNLRLNQPIDGMAASANGGGYWLVARDGGIFTFGSASFHGSAGSMHLQQPIVAMTPTPSGAGYWLLDRAGGVFSFGDAAYHGSLPGSHIVAHAVSITAPASGGYLVATSTGQVYGFGTTASGGPAGSVPTVAIAAAR